VVSGRATFWSHITPNALKKKLPVLIGRELLFYLHPLFCVILFSETTLSIKILYYERALKYFIINPS
jgi:hypothetical protein